MKIDELIREKMETYSKERKVAELADKVGIQQTTLSRFARTMNMSFDKVVKLIDYLGIEAADPGVDTEVYKMVPKVSAKAGAGSSLETSSNVEAFFAFRRDWLSKMGIRADQAMLLDVTGDSMEPLLRRGDTLLIDTGDQKLLDGKIYVVTLQDELLVKRIQKETGGIWLCSENRSYDRIVVPADHHEWLQVHGRVRWYGREL